MVRSDAWRVFMVLAATGASIPACGGGASIQSFEPESVPADKPVPELDPAEQDDFCEEALEWADEFLQDTLPRLLCRTQGIGAGSTAGGFDVAACEAAEQECLASGEFEVDEVTCNVSDIDPECDATVGEFATCFTEAANLSKRFLAELSCQGVAQGNVPNEADYELSPTCETLLDRCGGEASDETELETGTGGDSGESGDESGTGTGDPPPG